MQNVLNYPFKLNYPSGKFQFISERKASKLLEEEDIRKLSKLPIGQTYTDQDGDQWQRVCANAN